MQGNYKKKISQKNARKISKLISKDFNIPYCQIYYVDDLDKCLGIYSSQKPAHALIEASKENSNKIGVVIHELTHHIEYEVYGHYFNDPQHGYKYQLAKERMVNWCRRNISKNPNWYLPLKAVTPLEEMKKFKL